MKLNVWSFALGVGVVLGGTIFLATAIILLQHGGGHTLVLLRAYYLGYEVSWLGSLVGLGWGFVNGFVAGAVIALIHNVFIREKKEESQGE